jgi:hypothetical protein
MKKLLLTWRAIALSLILFSTQLPAHAQSVGGGKVEIGVGLGPLFFLGDLGGSQGYGKTFVKDVDIPLTKLCKGIYINIEPVEWLGFRLAGNVGVLEGNDAQTPNKGGEEVNRLMRNLSFRSKLLEGYAGIELYPTVFFENFDGLFGKLRPYAVMGLGVFHFDPETKDNNGNWVKLQPLHTEGQGFPEYPDRRPYALTQLEMPLGVGFKYYMSDNMYIGLEVLHRKLFTDYVDDVSTNYIDPNYFDYHLSPTDAALAKQLNYRGTYPWVTSPSDVVGEIRGDPKQNDAYFSTIIRIGWRMNGSNAPNGGAERQMRCPKFY